MASPSLTNNTPAPGSIAWDAFTIQYEDSAYQVPAGSTSSRWVWWRYSGGASIIEAGADIPGDLTDDDVVLFGNKNGIGIRIQATSLIDGELLVDGSIFANALSTHLIDSDHIVTIGLDAAVIKFGEMSGNRITANTINSDHIVTVGLDAAVIKFGEMSGNRIIANTINGDRIVGNSIVAGKIASDAIETRHMTAGTIAGDRIAANTLDASKIVALSITAAQIAASTITATQIAGTTITAAKIATGTITATQIAGTTITAAKIAANTITAAQIAANTITTKEMRIGDFTNYVENPGFEDGVITPHTVGGSTFSPSATARTGAFAGQFNTTAVAGTLFHVNGSPTDSTRNMKVAVGDKIRVSVWARNGAGTQTISPAIQIRNAAGVVVQSSPSNHIALTSAYAQYSVELTVTAATGFYAFGYVTYGSSAVGNGLLIDDIEIRKMVAGNLIVDGAIDGKTITGALIRSAATGARVELSDAAGMDDLRFYSGAGGEIKPGHVGARYSMTPSGDFYYTELASPLGMQFGTASRLSLMHHHDWGAGFEFGSATLESHNVIDLVAPEINILGGVEIYGNGLDLSIYEGGSLVVYEGGNITVGNISLKGDGSGVAGPFRWDVSGSPLPYDTWHTVGAGGQPGFQNGWSAVSGDPAQFKKTSSGLLVMRGLVQSGTNSSTVFTLPVGWRPGANDRFKISYAHSNLLGRLNVNADGTVVATGEAGFSFISLGCAPVDLS